MEYHIVKDQENLKRDPITGAILETDVQAYQKHIQEKMKIEKITNTSQRVASVESDINMLKDEMTEIKQLLRQLVNKNL